MSITSAIVLYAVIWFMVLFVVLPLRLTTQGDAGEVEPGTSASSPAFIDMKRKFRIVTLVAAVLWIVIAGVIFSGLISVRDLDFFNRMSPLPGDTGG
jgi:predicted secreted protein